MEKEEQSLVPAKLDWRQYVPATISKRNYSLVVETPDSAEKIWKRYGTLCGSFVSEELESIVWESFIEDLDDGRMHCLTIRDEKNDSEVCGVIFWRDLLESEMREWTEDIPSSESAVVNKNAFDGWIKIELVCTAPKYLGRRIGTMLMAAALVWAAKHRQTHSILHVAGGHKNVPAKRLYERFGFVETDKNQFNQPNDNLFVLWDINNSLQSIDWKTLLQPKLEGEIHTELDNLSLKDKET
eukprot:TRINITY_DN3798_c0_g1_i1.p1 TRINITY_DN3798_c0_g1~~TRINITY_DN3798_c0_g1_i1.p1  ORF type:complete len:241 (+),score=55.25 TRINITY_DN3798_c0_g1_i1:22-744(+)